MSSNRLKYDDCELENQNKRDVNQLNWIVDNNRFNNTTQCMVDLGTVSGNTQGVNDMGSRVDIESKLYGIGNKDSKCKDKSELPNQDNVLPSCKFYESSLKPSKLDTHDVVNTRCNNKLDL